MARGFGSTFGVGSTDVVESAYTTLVATPRSYSIWVYVNGLGGGSLGRVFDPATSTAGVDTLFISTEWNYQRAFSITPSTFQFPTASTPTGVWSHILIVYDASSILNVPVVYVNGVSQTVTVAGSPVGTATTTSNNYYLGNRQSGGNRNFDGMLAHFAIWNTSLTQADATTLAAGWNPARINPESLACYMPLDGINNPEWDIGVGPSVAITGTRFGTREPTVNLLFPDIVYSDYLLSSLPNNSGFFFMM